MKWSDLKNVNIRGFLPLPSTTQDDKKTPIIVDSDALPVYPDNAPKMMAPIKI